MDSYSFKNNPVYTHNVFYGESNDGKFRGKNQNHKLHLNHNIKQLLQLYIINVKLRLPPKKYILNSNDSFINSIYHPIFGGNDEFHYNCKHIIISIYKNEKYITLTYFSQ